MLHLVVAEELAETIIEAGVVCACISAHSMAYACDVSCFSYRLLAFRPCDCSRPAGPSARDEY